METGVVQATATAQSDAPALPNKPVHHLPVPVGHADAHLSGQPLHCLPQLLLLRLAQSGGEPPDCSNIRAAGPPSVKADAHLPMVWGSRLLQRRVQRRQSCTQILTYANRELRSNEDGFATPEKKLQASSVKLVVVILGPSYRGTNPEGTRQWLEIERASRPDGAIPAQPLREPITYARLHGMQVPTLVLSGEDDLLSPPALMRMLAAHIPTSRFSSLPDTGHAGFWEKPQVWNGLVLEFIGQH